VATAVVLSKPASKDLLRKMFSVFLPLPALAGGAEAPELQMLERLAVFWA
jgi:hypothetical protein